MKITWVKKLYQDNSGASSMEYSILLACIAIAILGAVVIFGHSVRDMFVQRNESFDK
jgi:Flp pilus assembly pilin Flp